jgi:anti-sigma factor RsiW
MNDVLHLSGRECARAHELLCGFVDGELPAEQDRWLGRHFESCGECRAELERFTATDSELTGWGRELATEGPAPTAARERLALKLTRVRRPGAIRWMLAVAATLAFAVIFVVPRQKPRVAGGQPAQFVGIPYLPPLDPRENASIVRMNIRVATLIAAGYRVSADANAIVPADVLVGEDGRAHAVRMTGDIQLN